MKISIITVCYNEEDVEKTCKSIIEQTWKDFEWIVIDGGSEQWCLDILEKYKSYMTYFVSEKDNGIYDAMNKGILKATGEYLNFMNAGDCLHDKNVFRDIFSQNLYCEDVIYGCEKRLGKNGTLNYIPKEKINFLNPLVWTKYTYHLRHQACFIKKELFEQYGLYDLEYKSASDYEAFLRFLYTHKRSHIYVDRNISIYKAYAGMSSDTPQRGQAEVDSIFIKNGFLEQYDFSQMLHSCLMKKMQYLLSRGKRREEKKKEYVKLKEIFEGLPFPEKKSVWGIPFCTVSRIRRRYILSIAGIKIFRV